ncbi:hypothetical protein BN1708_016549, partial [Verticillium longisporum]
MVRVKRNVLAAAEESTTPPTALEPNQSVAKVIKAEGNNLYTCLLPNKKDILLELAQRFRNTIWIKRGGYVLAERYDADQLNGRVLGEIPGFLSYAGVIIIGFFVAAFWAGPKWGKKTMLVYISICSWIGGLSVVATQGLGAAILTQIEGTPQFNKWFIYVLLVFVIGTLLIEIVYLNKALNIYNAAMVTPTYYVYFTSTTIITSAVLFRGFKGSANQIVSVVMGFLTICAGVVLLQLSKSAKDVPDTAVFTGNLDQIHTIAEQEQSETEPKADAIRGAAAIVRRFSATRQKREAEEFKRLHEEKQREQLAPVGEDGPEYEWDGLRRRKTMLGSQSSVGRGRSGTVRSTFTIPRTPEVHPPLGMSHFPTDDELADIDRPSSPGMMSSIAGTIRNRARSVLTPNRPDFSLDPKQHPPMPPVPLTDIAVSGHPMNDGSSYRTGPHGSDYGVSNTEYAGAKGVYHARHGSHVSGVSGGSSFLAPTPPPHTARRQFSFQNIFKRGQTSSSAVEADDELPHPPRYGEPGHTVELDVVMGNLGDGANYAFFNNITYAHPKVPTLYTALTSGDLATNPQVYGEYTHSFVLEKDEIVQIV